MTQLSKKSFMYSLNPRRNPLVRSGSHHPLNRYHQLWSQLKVVDNIMCRTYTPDRAGDVVETHFVQLATAHATDNLRQVILCNASSKSVIVYGYLFQQPMQ